MNRKASHARAVVRRLTRSVVLGLVRGVTGRLALGSLLGAGLLMSAGRASAAIELDALVGFGQSTTMGSHYRPETWTPLTVYLTGQGVRGIGQLQVTVHTGDKKTIYTQRVSLREGPLNEVQSFAVLLRTPNAYQMWRGGGTISDINIQLLMDGRELANKKVALPTSTMAETYNVLALTRDGSGLNFLTKKKLGLTHRHTNAANPGFVPQVPWRGNRLGSGSGGYINSSATLQVLYTDPRALPAKPQGYAMVDAIALADLPLDNLTEDQIDAVRGYVRDGGLLIVSGGGDLSRLKSKFYSEMLPIVPTSVLAARDVPDLERRYEQPLNLTEATSLTAGTLKPNAVALFSAAVATPPLPLISARPYGAGMVVFTAFDFQAPEWRSWKGTPALWRDLLRCGNDAVSPRDVLANLEELQNGNLLLMDALAGKQATNAPSFWLVFGFLGSYILLLVPVSYFLLKKLDKRELAWITSPLLILGFTIASYGIAAAIKGGMLTVHRAVVVEALANSDQAAGYGLMTLYSPSHTSYDIALGSPDDPNNPYRTLVPSEIFAWNATGNLTTELTVEHDKTTSLRNTRIKLWDKRSFETPIVAPMGGGIEAKTHLVDKQHMLVTVTNRTPYTLKDCALINTEQQAVPLGDLRPGEKREQTLHWVLRSNASGISLPAAPPVAFNGTSEDKGAETPEFTRSKVREAMTSTLTQYANQTQNINTGGWNSGAMSGYGRATNVLVGWFYDPLMDVRVNGKPAEGQEVNLLFVHLPTPQDAPETAATATNPFRTKPALGLEDEQPVGARKAGIFR